MRRAGIKELVVRLIIQRHVDKVNKSIAELDNLQKAYIVNREEC